MLKFSNVLGRTKLQLGIILGVQSCVKVEGNWYMRVFGKIICITWSSYDAQAYYWRLRAAFTCNIEIQLHSKIKVTREQLARASGLDFFARHKLKTFFDCLIALN
jgi:hypothetical protein